MFYEDHEGRFETLDFSSRVTILLKTETYKLV